MSLTPDPTIQKILISTTAHLTGVYQTETFMLSHAWPGFTDRTAVRRIGEAGISRQTLCLVFKTDPKEQEGAVIPSYDHVGDTVCALAAVLYGKRFDNHGPFESSGYYRLPNLDALNRPVDPTLPFNSHRPRVDLCIPLRIDELARLGPILFPSAVPIQQRRILTNASKFYLQALQSSEHDIEVAYLHLITAGEILSSTCDASSEHLYDAPIRAALTRIGSELSDGAHIVRLLSGRMRSIRRRFVVALASLVDDGFFTRSETDQPFARLKRESFLKTVGAAYDLRSQYVHSGRSFGTWVEYAGIANAERHVGRPVVDDPSFGRTLYAAPTFVGLERVTRYALIRFAETLGVDLTPTAAPDS